jgi:hypothetical protein
MEDLFILLMYMAGINGALLISYAIVRFGYWLFDIDWFE